jgi:hypothetical protein
MNIETLHSSEVRHGAGAATQFPPLESVTRPYVDTAAAAYYLNRQPQTLRNWACRSGTGPIEAHRIHGRLAWACADLRRLLGTSQ